MCQPWSAGTPSTSRTASRCAIPSTAVSALPTPSARAASIALHTAGKIEPPVGSCRTKPNMNSGTRSKLSASHCDERRVRTKDRLSALSGSASAAATRGA